MSRHVELLTIFLSSPGDIVEDRSVVRRVVEHLNTSWSRLTGKYFDVVGFEQVGSGIGTDPQDVINRAIGDEYDIYLGLMGNRLGTATARGSSGTIEEFERAIARWETDPSLRIKFYLKKFPSSESLTPEQSKDMEDIRNRLTDAHVFYKEYADYSELQTLLAGDLASEMQQWDNQSIEASKK